MRFLLTVLVVAAVITIVLTLWPDNPLTSLIAGHEPSLASRRVPDGRGWLARFTPEFIANVAAGVVSGLLVGLITRRAR